MCEAGLDRVAGLSYNGGMNKLIRGLVAGIALEVRIWAMPKAFRSNYNAHDLTGWCAIASGELHKRLTAAGIDAEIHMWISEYCECHCFCVVDDHVVDVTASQFAEFSSQEVVIMPMLEAMEFVMYRGTELFGTAKDLRRFQKRENWPSEQTCYA